MLLQSPHFLGKIVKFERNFQFLLLLQPLLPNLFEQRVCMSLAFILICVTTKKITIMVTHLHFISRRFRIPGIENIMKNLTNDAIWGTSTCAIPVNVTAT